MASRQPVPFEPGPGLEWVAVPDPGWRLDTEHLCRAGAGRYARSCGRRSAAALNRGRYTSSGRVDSWWAYCAEHMYGKWIEDGTVMQWILRHVGEGPKAEKSAR